MNVDPPAWANTHVCRDKAELRQKSSGLIWFQQVDPQDISASRIRDMIATQQLAKGQIPESVWEYIRSNQLYGYKS